jgi:hypothetical protein
LELPFLRESSLSVRRCGLSRYQWIMSASFGMPPNMLNCRGRILATERQKILEELAFVRPSRGRLPGGLREIEMLRKRKEPKPKKSIAETLLRDMQGTAAEKLAMFEKLRGRGVFDSEDPRELEKLENMLRTFASAEKR